MKNTWILVANATVARIFVAENNQKLKEIDLLEHPEGRLHERDLVSDRPGRAYESANTSRHAMDYQTSPKKHEIELFARRISNHLDAAYNAGKFDKLYIVANPQFLGLLRQTIVSPVEKHIAGEVDKDMTQMLAEDIRKNLPYVL